jgi:hypothetical protein
MLIFPLSLRERVGVRGLILKYPLIPDFSPRGRRRSHA